jgi:hypothetical protein
MFTRYEIGSNNQKWLARSGYRGAIARRMQWIWLQIHAKPAASLIRVKVS